MSSTRSYESNTPFGLLKVAIDAVPAVKYALGVAGIVSALALVKGLFANLTAALVGTGGMLVLMVLLVVFARTSRLGPNTLRLPSLVLAWATLTLFVGSLLLSVTCAFFGWPKEFGVLMEEVLKESPDALFLGRDSEMPVFVLIKNEATNEPVVNATVYIDHNGREACPRQFSQLTSPIRCALPKGEYRVVVDYKGQTRTQPIRVAGTDMTITVFIPVA